MANQSIHHLYRGRETLEEITLFVTIITLLVFLLTIYFDLTITFYCDNEDLTTLKRSNLKPWFMSFKANHSNVGLDIYPVVAMTSCPRIARLRLVTIKNNSELEELVRWIGKAAGIQVLAHDMAEIHENGDQDEKRTRSEMVDTRNDVVIVDAQSDSNMNIDDLKIANTSYLVVMHGSKSDNADQIEDHMQSRFRYHVVYASLVDSNRYTITNILTSNDNMLHTLECLVSRKLLLRDQVWLKYNSG